MFTYPNYCPNCGQQNIKPFAPTPFGFYCKDCEHHWDEIPEDEDE